MNIIKFRLFFAIGWMTVICCLTTSFFNPGKRLENAPPEVVIVKPSQNDMFFWNTLIQYKIKVTDKEDGNSEYDEINTNEVLLEVCYLPDAASAKIYMDKKKKGKENSGLTRIRQSDCFTCHASKTKLIGPSFEMIAKRYRISDSSVDRLAKSIISGSTGTWSGAAMPAHHDIKVNDAKQIVKWILSNGAVPSTTFYPGIEGAFKTGKPHNESAKMVMVLTASYTDHGDNESTQNSKYGQYSVSLKPNN